MSDAPVDPTAPNAPDPASPPEPPTPAPAADDPDKDWKAEYEKLQRESRKNEDRNRINRNAAKELETLRQQTLTDTERAVEAARTEGRTEATRALGARLVQAEVRAAAAGRDERQVEALLEVVDAGKFLDDDGEPDTAAIKRWVAKALPAAAEPDPTSSPFPNLGQGARPSNLPASAEQEFANFVRGQLGT